MVRFPRCTWTYLDGAWATSGINLNFFVLFLESEKGGGVVGLESNYNFVRIISCHKRHVIGSVFLNFSAWLTMPHRLRERSV
jgi:hypothetical protein